MSVGAFLRKCRTRANLSQAELAYRLYINQSDVSKYESDAKEPPISLARDWAVVTQAPEYLIAFILSVDSGAVQKMLESTNYFIGLILGVIL